MGNDPAARAEFEKEGEGGKRSGPSTAGPCRRDRRVGNARPIFSARLRREHTGADPPFSKPRRISRGKSPIEQRRERGIGDFSSSTKTCHPRRVLRR